MTRAVPRAACAFSRSSVASRATVAPLRTSDGTRPKTSDARSRALVQVVSSGSGCASSSAFVIQSFDRSAHGRSAQRDRPIGLCRTGQNDEVLHLTRQSHRSRLIDQGAQPFHRHRAAALLRRKTGKMVRPMIIQNEMGQALVHRAELERSCEPTQNLAYGPVLDEAPLLRLFGGRLDLLKHFAQCRILHLLLENGMSREAMREGRIQQRSHGFLERCADRRLGPESAV